MPSFGQNPRKGFPRVRNGYRMESRWGRRAMFDYSNQALGATERAMARAASVAHEDLNRGLNTLATITCLAPFVGILGTSWAIGFDTFFGISGSKESGLA